MRKNLLSIFAILLAATAFAATNTPDENGIVPSLWWDCAGNFAGSHSKGSSDSNDVINPNVTNNWTAFTRARGDAQGAILLDHVSEAELGAPWFRVRDYLAVGRDWTVSFTARTSYDETA